MLLAHKHTLRIPFEVAVILLQNCCCVPSFFHDSQTHLHPPGSCSELMTCFCALVATPSSARHLFRNALGHLAALEALRNALYINLRLTYLLTNSSRIHRRPCVCRGRSTSVEQFTASSPLNLHIDYYLLTRAQLVLRWPTGLCLHRRCVEYLATGNFYLLA